MTAENKIDTENLSLTCVEFRKNVKCPLLRISLRYYCYKIVLYFKYFVLMHLFVFEYIR